MPRAPRIIRRLRRRRDYHGWAVRLWRFGCAIRIATDGKPWTWEGRPYTVHTSRIFWQFAVKRLNIMVCRRLLRRRPDKQAGTR